MNNNVNNEALAELCVSIRCVHCEFDLISEVTISVSVASTGMEIALFFVPLSLFLASGFALLAYRRVVINDSICLPSSPPAFTNSLYRCSRGKGWHYAHCTWKKKINKIKINLSLKCFECIIAIMFFIKVFSLIYLNIINI